MIFDCTGVIFDNQELITKPNRALRPKQYNQELILPKMVMPYKQKKKTFFQSGSQCVLLSISFFPLSIRSCNLLTSILQGIVVLAIGELWDGGGEEMVLS